MDRRRFLQLAGTFAVNAVAGGVVSGCHNSSSTTGDSIKFTQGVASGDPGPTSVVLWTRAEPAGQEIVPIRCEVSSDPDFSRLFLNEQFQVDHRSDYTLRVLLENLAPDSYYYYRFIANNNVVSELGRTRTAPEPNQNTPIQFAFVSCQEQLNGFYGAYRRMILDDQRRPSDQQIRFVLHLGDFIYETRNESFQRPVDALNNPIDGDLVYNSGEKRWIPPFPQGGVTPSGIEYARTLEDYRHLYRHYLQDPHLQAARARWPFICIWDDHEFSNDCWQSEANYIDIGNNSSTDEPSQQRKVAANQAWFEYTPANLTKPETMDEDLVHMKPFESVSVNNTPNDTMDDNNLSSNEDNLSAIGSMTIYRSLRFGQFVNLLLTDNRSYRSDHAIPESISGNSSFFLHPRVASPLNILNQLDAGKTANEGSPNSHIYTGEVIPNPRLNSPPGTVLGSPQKHWWKEILRRSDTDWNIWANSIPLTRLLLNLSAADGTLPDAVLSSDTWDGYCTERNELMAYLLNNGIDNLVSFSGDLHAHIAGLVMHDYEVFHNSDTTDQ
ncbi:MAG: alkaline phosphatase D family protein, partial [Gammaproteobacteria bacterium]|nr:alkaline phosphatase D family protein [Gammaproteobacteria bacterium]